MERILGSLDGRHEVMAGWLAGSEGCHTDEMGEESK